MCIKEYYMLGIRTWSVVFTLINIIILVVIGSLVWALFRKLDPFSFNNMLRGIKGKNR